MTTTTLKLTALLFMLLDHMYTFLWDMPLWMTWLGRLAAPLFIFCMVWGLQYTHDRKRYLLHMYFWSLGMAAGDVLFSFLLPGAKAAPNNNIFTTLLLIGIIVTIIEYFQKDNKPQAIKLLLLFFATQLTGTILFLLISAFLPKGYNLYILAVSIFPNVLFCEGGFLWVGLGVILFFTKERRALYSAAVILCAVMITLLLKTDFTFEGLFLQNYEWMMIGALPFMLSYNGKKGHGFKLLFYIFYPAHIFFLCWLGSVL